MNGQTQITGLFADEDACARAVTAVRKAGFGMPRVFSPFTSEKILEALHALRSPVRLWVLLGGMTGCATGFALTIGLSLEYPHRTAGMPIVSIPPFVIIAFELTILFGVLSAVLSFLLYGRFPRIEPEPGYDVQFSNDRFGLVVSCVADAAGRAETLLREAGAVEVTRAGT
jgi:Alternative complex III, ActD subunit